jgi:putative transposase
MTGRRGTRDPKQRWLTFVRNHAKVIVAADFFVVITAAFRTLYVFVVIEIGSLKILHQNVTSHPTARMDPPAIPGSAAGRSSLPLPDPRSRQHLPKDVDQGLANLGVRVLRAPVRAPKANAVCERLGGSLRRECLDVLVSVNERHLHGILREWTTRYNRGRPHSALGPGLPEPISEHLTPTEHRHQLPIGYRVVKRPVLGGLHHEYGLAKEAA